MPEKQVIDPKIAAGGGAKAPQPVNEAPQAHQMVRRVWKFVKTQVPAEVITLPCGEKIEFRIPRTQHNGFAPVGSFETEDETIAKELTEISRKGNHFVLQA